jgi:hypothetical protein
MNTGAILISDSRRLFARLAGLLENGTAIFLQRRSDPPTLKGGRVQPNLQIEERG